MMVLPSQCRRLLVNLCGELSQLQCSSLAPRKDHLKLIVGLARRFTHDARQLEGAQMLEHPLTQTESFTGETDTSGLPSVTRVLGATRPVESELALLTWKKKMIAELGEDGFNAMQKATLKAGSQCHAAIERRLSGEANIEADPSWAALWESVQPVLDRVGPVHVVEGKYAHPHLGYYGYVDCVGHYKGALCSIDWKTSSKPRYTLSECYDDPLQVAAYAGAVNCSLPPDQQIHEGLVVKIYHDGKPATAFRLNAFTLEYFWRKWLKRLAAYNLLKETAKKKQQRGTRQLARDDPPENYEE